MTGEGKSRWGAQGREPGTAQRFHWRRGMEGEEGRC